MTSLEPNTADDMPDIVAFALPASSKKQALELLAERLAESTGISKRLIMSALVERERLGSTAIGNGFALPHAVIESAETTTTMVATFAKPVDFDADDDQPVDVVAVVLGANGGGPAYKAVVADATEILRKKGEMIREAKNVTALKEVLAKELQEAA